MFSWTDSDDSSEARVGNQPKIWLFVDRDDSDGTWSAHLDVSSVEARLGEANVTTKRVTIHASHGHPSREGAKAASEKMAQELAEALLASERSKIKREISSVANEYREMREAARRTGNHEMLLVFAGKAACAEDIERMLP